MKLNGQSTVGVCRQTVENLLTVPPLFDEPPGGYLRWATHMAEVVVMVSDNWNMYVDVVLDKVDLTQIASPKIVGDKTISGRLIAATGPAWRYGMILPTILTGDYENYLLDSARANAPDDVLEVISGIKDAEEVAELYLLEGQLQQLEKDTTTLERAIGSKRSRILFETGSPLYVGVHRSEERYRTFAPILTYKGDGRYIVGDKRKYEKFKADSHNEALVKARGWFLVVREDEIDGAKKNARNSALQGTPPIVYDTLVAILMTDKQLYDEDGTRLAAENGAHGLYAIQGPDWCYVTNCSAEKATQLAMVALKESASVGEKTSMMVKTTGRMAEYLGFNGFREEDDGSLAWDSKMAPKWVPANGSVGNGRVLNALLEPILLTKMMIPENGRFSHDVSVKVVGGDGEVINSVVPARWGFTDTDAILWAVRAGLNRRKANERRAQN